MIFLKIDRTRIMAPLVMVMATNVRVIMVIIGMVMPTLVM